MICKGSSEGKKKKGVNGSRTGRQSNRTGKNASWVNISASFRAVSIIGPASLGKKNDATDSLNDLIKSNQVLSHL